MIKIAVIGVGSMGKNHARVYSEMSNVELIGVVDNDGEVGRNIAGKFDTSFFSDYKDVINNVDAVSIAAPTKFHHGIAMYFLNKGIDVLLEKPITLNLDEADELIEIAGKNNLILQVGHIERFNPAIIELKNFVNADNIVSIEANRIGPFGARITDAGVVLDLMIHDIDIILSLINDEIESVNAYGKKVKSKHEDFAIALMKFKNGNIANLTASRITQKRERTLKITQRDNYIIADYMNKTIELHKQAKSEYITEDKNVKYIYSDVVEKPYISQAEPLKLELQSFIDCVKTREKPIVDGKAGRNALDVALRIINKI